MRWMLLLVLAASAAIPASAWPPDEEFGTPRVTWNFRGDRSNHQPDGFGFGVSGSERDGRWRVVTEKGAPSGSKVLAQLDAQGEPGRLAVAFAEQPEYRDVALSAQCMQVSTGGGCGLVLRYQDEKNFYALTAGEGEVVLRAIVKGKRYRVSSAGVQVTENGWSELRVELRRDLFNVFWRGKELFECRSERIPHTGKVGVCARGGTVCRFDDVTAEPLNSR